MKKNLFFVLLLCSVLQGTSQTPAEFKSPADRYRPKPLWFWNNTTVTRKGIDTQLKALKEQAGYGGVSILPFGAKFGPKYLSPEYFDLYEYTAEKAEALGMQLSLYDEYGFPSGSGGAIGGDDIPRFLNLSLIHLSEPTRRTPISYAVFCLKKKKRPGVSPCKNRCQQTHDRFF